MTVKFQISKFKFQGRGGIDSQTYVYQKWERRVHSRLERSHLRDMIGENILFRLRTFLSDLDLMRVGYTHTVF